MVAFAALAPVIAAGISAAASVGGGIMSASGAAGANAANVNMQTVSNAQNLAHAQWVQSQNNDAFWANFHNQNEQAGINRTFASDQASRFMSFEADQARQQMAFQERMSNTQYQRAMADMRSAGLNPILAYQQGGAGNLAGAAGGGSAASGSMPGTAGGPGGTSAGQQAARVMNDKELLGRAIGNAVHSGADVLRSMEGVELMKKQGGLVNEQERRVGYETSKLDAETGAVLANTEVLKANAATAREVTKITQLERENMERYGQRAAPDTLERVLRSVQGAIEDGRMPVGR